MDPPPPRRPHLDTTQLQPLASSAATASPIDSLDDDDDHDDHDSLLDSPESHFDDPALDLDHSGHDHAASPHLERERRRRMRRMYGGGRHRHRGLHAPGAGWDAESVAAEDDEGEGEGAVRAGQGAGVGEVAGMILAASLSPFPLLLPLACSQLGPGLFVPLLLFASALAWLGGVVIGVEGRYVGARSFPGLASGVFPHRFKLHKVGEVLAAAFVLGGSIVRTALGVVATAEIVVDVVVPEHRRRDWERGIAVGVVCLTWLLVPLLLRPLLSLLGLSSRPSSTSSYARLSSTSSPDLALSPVSPAFSLGPSASSSGAPPRARWTALLRLPSWSVALLTWPVALLVFGIRMRQLNRNAAFHSTSTSAVPPSFVSSGAGGGLAVDFPLLDPADEHGISLWPAILVVFAAPLGASHEAFYHLASLARPSSTASRGGEAQARAGAFSLVAAAGAGDDDGDAGLAGAGPGAGAGGRGAEREGKRNGYPLALLVGHGGAFLISLGWALVGSLSLPSSPLRPWPSTLPSTDAALVPPAPNFLTDGRLPRADATLGAVRLLVLAALVAQVEGHAAIGIGRVRRAVRGLGGEGVKARAARRTAARVVVWAAVAGLAAVLVAVPAVARGGGGKKGPGWAGEGKHPRGHGEGMLRVAEWCGVFLGGIGGCLVPAVAYLVLFHLRRPRSILLPPSTSPSASTDTSVSTTDALLARKERQMQRRLSGRRVWTDAGVFGLLGPVGVLLVARGAVVLIGGREQL
ncbi:hypothetical protein JCM8208_001925 [Rhodotorula glutinis]